MWTAPTFVFCRKNIVHNYKTCIFIDYNLYIVDTCGLVFSAWLYRYFPPFFFDIGSVPRTSHEPAPFRNCALGRTNESQRRVPRNVTVVADQPVLSRKTEVEAPNLRARNTKADPKARPNRVDRGHGDFNSSSFFL